MADVAREDEAVRELLRATLESCAAPDLTASDENVFYLHRVKDGFHVYFVANMTQQDRGRVQLSFEQTGVPEVWNPTTGTIQRAPVYRVADGRVHMELPFPPSESYVVAFADAAHGPHVTETGLDVAEVADGHVVAFARDGAAPTVRVSRGEGQEQALEAEAKAAMPHIALPEEYAFEIEEDNVLVVERWKMRVADGNEDATWTAKEHDTAGWLDVTNGAWEMQLPQERDEATYPVTLHYRTSFHVTTLPANPRLLIDGFAGGYFRLWVNGEEIRERGTRSRLDAEMREVDLAGRLQTGDNTVALELIVRQRTDGVLDLLKIVGDFGVTQAADGPSIDARPTRIGTGDWTRQGFPWFSGTGIYRCEVDVPAAYFDGGRLCLEADCGEDVLEVRVGDASVVAPWRPQRLDLTAHLRPGMNTLELCVTNTLLNILEGEPQASGLFSPPRIVHEPRYEFSF